MGNGTDNCHAVSALCPVEATTLGYYPNLGANAFFLASFALCSIATVAIGVWKRTWAFGIVVGAGFILETCGIPPNPALQKALSNSAYRIHRPRPNALQSLVRPGLQNGTRLHHPRTHAHLRGHLPDPETRRAHRRPKLFTHKAAPIHLDLHPL